MPDKTDLYIGLMSGTSLDAIDAVLVNFGDDAKRTVDLVATHEHPFPAKLRNELQALIASGTATSLDDLGRIDRELGVTYAGAVNELLANAGTAATDVTAVGNHGQTIRHQPDAEPAFTMQIGDAATIATVTGIPTVADFRSADVALGGQGAPMVCGFHEWAFAADDSPAVVVNIGGIANVTVLQPGAEPLGYDTGPGNTLLDDWYGRHHKDSPFDADGAWAASGTVNQNLLAAMQTDSYFNRPAPKSTGREYFHSAWLDRRLQEAAADASPADVQATLAELTASTIGTAVKSHLDKGAAYLCGGGARNADLAGRIGRALPDLQVESSLALGVDPAWVEAVAFAWLARARLQQIPAGQPSVTGARAAAILGAVYLPPEP